MLSNGGSPAYHRPILFLIHGVIRKATGSFVEPAAAESAQNLRQRGHRGRTLRRTCRFKRIVVADDRGPDLRRRLRSALSADQGVRVHCVLLDDFTVSRVTVSGPSIVHFDTALHLVGI
jgi:hypothetical protein